MFFMITLPSCFKTFFSISSYPHSLFWVSFYYLLVIHIWICFFALSMFGKRKFFFRNFFIQLFKKLDDKWYNKNLRKKQNNYEFLGLCKDICPWNFMAPFFPLVRWRCLHRKNWIIETSVHKKKLSNFFL